jgi:hypothetical protein
MQASGLGVHVPDWSAAPQVEGFSAEPLPKSQ